jgi:hypothetical protein
MQSVSITTDVVSSNLDQGEMYNITKSFVGVIYCILNILQHHTKKKRHFTTKWYKDFRGEYYWNSLSHTRRWMTKIKIIWRFGSGELINMIAWKKNYAYIMTNFCIKVLKQVLVRLINTCLYIMYNCSIWTCIKISMTKNVLIREGGRCIYYLNGFEIWPD